MADVVDLDDDLELILEAAGVADDGHGSSSLRAHSRQLGLERPRVLTDAEDDELGGLVRGEPHPPDELAILADRTHPQCPAELRVALLAWQHTRRAAQNQPQAASNPHQELRRWLDANTNTHNLTEGAIDRIASVANWKKRAGATSR